MSFFRPTQRPVDMDSLTDRLREVSALERPAEEFAPQQPPDYSIERVQSFLSSHIQDLEQAEATLAVEEDKAKQHLAEVERRREVTKIARDALADTLANVTNKVAALDATPTHEADRRQPYSPNLMPAGGEA